MPLFERTKPLDPNAPSRPKTMGKRERRRIWKEAVNAAQKAARECKPAPMVVQQRASALNDRSPVVKEWVSTGGVCGFAWLRMKGTTAMGRFLSAEKIASPGHPSGLMVPSHRLDPKIGQSLEQAQAAARAAAKVLNAHGVEAWVESRMD